MGVKILYNLIIMQRVDIIEKIGRKYLTSNIENDEFSYKQELKIPII